MSNYKKYLNSKWTSVEIFMGWRHFQVKTFIKKSNDLELFAVCDKKVTFTISTNEIKDPSIWISGWIEVD